MPAFFFKTRIFISLYFYRICYSLYDDNYTRLCHFNKAPYSLIFFIVSIKCLRLIASKISATLHEHSDNVNT